jgi:hypothetical protein
MTEERRTHVPPERVARRIPVRPGLRHILTLGVEVRMLLHVLDDDVTKRDVIILCRSDGEGEEQRVEMGGLEEVRPGYVEAIFNGVIPGLAYDCTIEPGGDSEKVYPVFVKTIIANDDGAFEILMPEEEEPEAEGEEGAAGAEADESEPAAGTSEAGASESGEESGAESTEGEEEAEEETEPSADLVVDSTDQEWTDEGHEFYTRGVIADDFYEGVEEQEDEGDQEQGGFGGSDSGVGSGDGGFGGSGSGQDLAGSSGGSGVDQGLGSSPTDTGFGGEPDSSSSSGGGSPRSV